MTFFIIFPYRWQKPPETSSAAGGKRRSGERYQQRLCRFLRFAEANAIGSRVCGRYQRSTAAGSGSYRCGSSGATADSTIPSRWNSRGCLFSTSSFDRVSVIDGAARCGQQRWQSCFRLQSQQRVHTGNRGDIRLFKLRLEGLTGLITPNSFSSASCSQASRGVSANGRHSPCPALLINMSAPPPNARPRQREGLNSASFSTSQRQENTSPSGYSFCNAAGWPADPGCGHDPKRDRPRPAAGAAFQADRRKPPVTATRPW